MAIVALMFLTLLRFNGGYMYNFKNYSLYEVYAYNDQEREYLYWIYSRETRCYFCTLPTNEAALPMSIIVKKKFDNGFEYNLRLGGVQFYYRSSYRLKRAENVMISNSIMDPSMAFMTWDGIQKWYDAIDSTSLLIQKKIIGLTYNREDIVLLELSKGSKNFGVLITGGEDAKDWMSTAVLLNFVYTLTRNSTYFNILDYYDVYILASSNPDGYKYSMEVDRFWTKNRRVIYPQKLCQYKMNHSIKEAVGVNIDRNWYRFSEYMLMECDTIYPGETEHSEQESKALLGFLNLVATKLMAFVNVKGFGKMITIPYAEAELTNNHDLMMELLSSVSDRLKEKYNETYLYGTTASFLFKYTGNVADWVKSELNIPVVYTVHLQFQDHIFPDALDIAPLTEQLSTILNQTLMLAKDIYGPLFNNQAKNPIRLHYIFILIIIAFMYD